MDLQTIKEKLSRLKPFTDRLKRRKTTLITLIVIVLMITGSAAFAWKQSSRSEKSKQQTLAQLELDRIKVAEATNTQLNANENHTDVSELEFKDISEGEFNRPTCKKLEKRAGVIITSSSCDYHLRAFGKLTKAVVFVYENESAKNNFIELTNANANNKKSLFYINTYLKEQATRYKVNNPPEIGLSFYGPFQVSEPVVNLYYRINSSKLIEIYNEASKINNVPEADFDMVHFVLLDNVYGGWAFPSLHRAFTYNTGYNTVPIFVHETLHLLGAADKYNNNDCNTVGTNDPFGRYNGSIPGNDIMCLSFSLDSSKINDITAREIGWAN